jgi:hypothetical protein
MAPAAARRPVARDRAALLRATDGSAAWSGSFDEDVHRRLRVQDRYSARVAASSPGCRKTSKGSGGKTPANRRPARAPGHAVSGCQPALPGRVPLRPRACAPTALAERACRGLYQHGASTSDPGYALAWVAPRPRPRRRGLFGADGAAVGRFRVRLSDAIRACAPADLPPDFPFAEARHRAPRGSGSTGLDFRTAGGSPEANGVFRRRCSRMKSDIVGKWPTSAWPASLLQSGIGLDDGLCADAHGARTRSDRRP